MRIVRFEIIIFTSNFPLVRAMSAFTAKFARRIPFRQFRAMNEHEILQHTRFTNQNIRIFVIRRGCPRMRALEMRRDRFGCDAIAGNAFRQLSLSARRKISRSTQMNSDGDGGSGDDESERRTVNDCRNIIGDDDTCARSRAPERDGCVKRIFCLYKAEERKCKNIFVRSASNR